MIKRQRKNADGPKEYKSSGGVVHNTTERDPRVSGASPAFPNNGDFASLVFCQFAIVNLIAAFFAPILDCDEVFNYWEPTHYLNHGYGLQTWEYSPEYAIRSWLYILVHAIPGSFASLITRKSSLHLYLIRACLGLTCAFCETCLHGTISKELGSRVAFLFKTIALSSTGMFYASVAFLPSSFAMMTTMLGMASFMSRQDGVRTNAGIAWFGLGAIVGWPFSAALILPLLFDEALSMFTGGFAGLFLRIMGGSAWLLMISVLDVLVNTFFYRKPVFVPWRIVSYNVFSGASRGPDIFGTEPWHFYLRNLLLNFNIWSLFALMSGPVLLLQLLLRIHSSIRMSTLRTFAFCSPFYLWLAIFSVQPHKEERFMYPAYPFLCLSAAVALNSARIFLEQVNAQVLAGKIPPKLRLLLSVGGLIAVLAIGVVRTVGTVSAYSAPLEVYEPLHRPELIELKANVCLGKEWYRFPSSFFLPKHMRAKFIKSAFTGLLPGEFNESSDVFGVRPTWLTPSGMNDQNLEDPSKYTNIEQCSFLVDSTMSNNPSTDLEPDYIENHDGTMLWEKITCKPFLDSPATPLLARIFWTPEWGFLPRLLRRQWGSYCLLQRKPIGGQTGRKRPR